jgi:N6-L-threonylcarbamoyladenine synthase
VAASPQLRAAAKELCDEFKVKLCLPPLKWSTDNGAMIGLAAWDNVTLNLSHALKPVTSLAITDI